MLAPALESIEYATEPVALLRKDLKTAATLLDLHEVRFLVDFYYQMQQYRIASAAQTRTLAKEGQPHLVLDWVMGTMGHTEGVVRSVLDYYTRGESTGMGAWAREIVGIGPVISAGLLAHIDITQAPTVGHIWRFAGLDPTLEWGKGQKRPWNASLKVLAYKIGESFVKVQNHPRDIYGQVYAKRKVEERERNEAGLYADQAAAKMAKFKISKDTEAYRWYSDGKLPPAHIHARARRVAVKLFLAHFWEEWYVRHYGKEPPLPYAIAFLGHAHKIERPGHTP